MRVTRKALDKIATDYHSADGLQDKHIEDMCQDYTFDWVLKHLRGASTVLEMGYGEGNFTALLSRRPIELTVLEGSPLLVQKARKIYGETVRFECSFFETYQPKGKFDAIVATHVLEHVDNPVDLLRRMKKWLSPQGKIIIIVPNKESLHRQLAVLMKLQPALDTLGGRDQLVGHQRVYSLATLAADVRRAGLKVTKQEGFFLKMLPNSMMLGFSRELLQALNDISPILPDRLLGNIGMVTAS